MQKKTMRHTFGIAVLGLLLANCAMSNGPDPYPQPALPDSTWLAEDINQAGVLDRMQSTLTFDVNMNVSGNGGCNRYFGSAAVSAPSARSAAPEWPARRASWIRNSAS